MAVGVSHAGGTRTLLLKSAISERRTCTIAYFCIAPGDSNAPSHHRRRREEEVDEGAPIVFVHEFAAAAVPGSMSNKIIHKGLAHLTANRAVPQRQFLS